ncbi:META domain-containing protein [Microbulbifer halophilus]|uniref:META domain-containing protein n=1 Tax=Microbulbifer halophilus TaxID=453963 RepID=A0ABW5EFP7_9GAMM|nr:META domain-containing protein [Microbulbifer halophilus]MCW8126240.1 META domain-containing protein [Microbulbifer halophilus]
MLRRYRLPAALLVAILPLAAPGCATGGAVPQESAVAADIAGDASVCDYQWLLERLSLDGREHRSRLLWQKLWRDRPYFLCDKLGYVRGSAGSNPYIGRFSMTSRGSISWPQPPEISRMTGKRDSSELEEKFLAALPRTDTMKLRGDSLILQGDGGATRLEFKRTEGLPE